MRNLFLLALVATLAGCASNGEIVKQYSAASQNYRLKGDDSPITISGKIQKIAAGLDGYHVLNISVNNDEVIKKAPLDTQYFGEGQGKYKDKLVLFSCTSNLVSDDNREVRCMIFIDNEKTVTLTS